MKLFYNVNKKITIIIFYRFYRYHQKIFFQAKSGAAAEFLQLIIIK